MTEYQGWKVGGTYTTAILLLNDVGGTVVVGSRIRIVAIVEKMKVQRSDRFFNPAPCFFNAVMETDADFWEHQRGEFLHLRVGHRIRANFTSLEKPIGAIAA